MNPATSSHMQQQVPVNPSTGQYDVLPFGVSLEDYIANGTNSYYIKAFTKAISPYFRPGALTRRESDRVMMSLLSFLVDTVDQYFMKFSARFLTPDDFEEVINERNIVHTCGYPLCAKVPKNANGQYKIEYKYKGFRIMHPYLTKYCSKEHASAAVFFQKQLSYEPVFLREDITFLPYGKSTFESHTASLEELEYLSRAHNISIHQAAQQFAVNAIQASKEAQQTGEQQATTAAEDDDELAKLAEKLSFYSIEERDPNDTNMDDLAGVDEELIGNPSAIEGYKARN